MSSTPATRRPPIHATLLGLPVVVWDSTGNQIQTTGTVTSITGSWAAVREHSGRTDEWPLSMLEAYDAVFTPDGEAW